MNQILLRTRRFNVERVPQKLSDGSVLYKEVIRHNGAVVILPLMPEGKVCLIRNFRPALNRSIWELPAGTLELNEPPLKTAIRELQEETGLTANMMMHVHTFCMSPGILDEKMHFFVASELSIGNHAREPGEEMENHFFTWADIDRMLRDGDIVDGKTLVSLLWYLRYRTHA
jgi:ADP-ribose pyrophosphatase